MTSTIERPTAGAQLRRATYPLRIRATGDTGLATISGYASVWGERNSWGEVFVPGAFTDALALLSDRKPLPIGYMHRDVCGRWTNAEEDQTGLFLEGPLSDTQVGRDASTLCRDGAITGLSVGFIPSLVAWADPDEEVTFETPFGTFTNAESRWTIYILKANLAEASLVIAPADDEARLTQVRSAAAQARKAMPLGDDASWEDAAYSMGLLMGGRGAGAFDDLAAHERLALYQRITTIYERHTKTPPNFTTTPDFAAVEFRHDEREIFQDRYLRKTLDTLVAGASSTRGALSPQTREAATRAHQQLTELLERKDPRERHLELTRELKARAHATLTKEAGTDA